ncbi:TAT-variant-translocated molybdopterin oxidoreductase [Candidatus Amoebophilus asiaticus]|nr:TAT-variant-translocated molybdopterin oxidoreductase [Candidatus Amoebophilus asiaticus]
MGKEKKYWRGLEELKQEPEFENKKHKEFAEDLPYEKGILIENGNSPDRRDFLKMMGFGLAAASLASCEMPVNKAIPYLNKPEEITPGEANWYASTFADGVDYCSILVKTREGRPIKIEGNEASAITQGGASARVHASILSLYDEERLRNPVLKGEKSTWNEVDSAIKQKLGAIATKEGKIVLLTSTIISPSTKKIISEFLEKYPTAKHVTYDAVSQSSIITAHKNCFEKTALPRYRFDKANVIVSFGADFLGTWISPVEFTKQYSSNRKPERKKMSRHIQFETSLSVTGANADLRLPVKPSQIGLAILNLYNYIAKEAGAKTYTAEKIEFAGNAITNTAKELWKNRGKSLVVAGSNDVGVQEVVCAINSLLDSYGNTIDMDNHSNLRQGNDAEMIELVNQMKNGNVDALIAYHVNPVYDYCQSKDFLEGFKKVGLRISFALKVDETAENCDYMCPDHHYLESWNDAEPYLGYFSLGQPTINPIFNTRAAQESLLKWMGNNQGIHPYIKNYWKTNLFEKQSRFLTFTTFWNKTLHEGVFELPHLPAQGLTLNKDLGTSVDSIKKNYKANSDKTELVLYEKVAIRNGKDANNPWLQELPDPISRAAWDNYLAISPRHAKEMGLKQEDVVELSAKGVQPVKIPVLIQPGQAYQTVSLAVGYGRTKAGLVAEGIGKNAYPFATIDDGTVRLHNSTVAISKTDETYPLAQTQTQHTIVGRPIIKETTLEEYKQDPHAGNKDKPHLVTLYDKFEPKGHHWAMVIDLNACTGCGSCVVSCTAENNVPVVGKDEIRNKRDMHWLRIDRYYSESKTDDHEPEENPEVTFQPMLCQHCDNAPCENVCPVAATNHSSEGINQMAYNRCIGTRFCANNCPYKVRRFNWFDYADNDAFPSNSRMTYSGDKDVWGMTKPLPRMALNPDVTVRSRGVMEKCSFCIQRVQKGKLDAKIDGRNVKDGEVKTACQQSCPANAIVFGDLLDPNSAVSKLYKNERKYHVLEELHTLPSIGYLTKVRNRTNEEKSKKA